MAGDCWMTMPFDQAVQVNPAVPLKRGFVYPFVDMQSVNPYSRSVGPSEMREFSGGGSRFIAGDTLMARITPCLENGKIARFAPNGEQMMGHGSTEFIVIRGRPNVTDNDFAYYLTKWDGVRLYLISQMTGSSGRQRVPTSALSQCEVVIPPIKEQRAIACILGALDDKIELNRRMNQTLEDMARAIFKSWFVDFDPVRYKAAGQHPPGLAPHIADLFPDSFTDFDLGQIPKGWNVRSLTEEFNLTMGQSPPGHTYNEDGQGLPFYQGIRDFGYRYPKKRVFCINPSRIAEAGDTLVSVRAPVAEVNMASEKCCIGRGLSALRHRSGSRSYTYYSIKSLKQTLAKFEAEGTVFGAITKKGFESIKVISIPLQIVKQFENLLFPIDERIAVNEREIHVLESTRDALLPKLISGELRVSDAERIAGRCT